jgi:CheY-like chemotaxis protein
MLSEDGQLSEAILREFLSLEPYDVPSVTRVTTGAEAFVALGRSRPYDLVVASMQIGDMSASDLARRVRGAGFATPVVALAHDARDLDGVTADAPGDLDRVFLWQGDFRILPAIVKDVEDRRNAPTDTGEMGVQAIIVIEDSIRYYSSFLPAIYTELVRHSKELAPEGLNVWQRLLRLRARPKILLCHTYEQAWRAFELYEQHILGVISDMEFPHAGRLQADGGLEFAHAVRARQADIPVMLQSATRELEAETRVIGATFLLKDSPTLLHDLQRFMIDNFGFGDFVFRRPDGTRVGEARTLRALEEQLRTAPADSIAYHAERNHFSKWLKARTEFALAHSLRPRKVSDFTSVEHLRSELVRSIHEYRTRLNRGIVADFASDTFDPATTFCRIGAGSLGGKGRGLALVNLLVSELELDRAFPGVRVSIPPAVVLCTEVFDRFLDLNRLRGLALTSGDDAEVERAFLAAPLPKEAADSLAAYLMLAKYPLAVRSSSLLEDSRHQPFAGVYDTWMLPNAARDPDVRVRQLLDAIRRVYASTFSARARSYMAQTPYRLEEEKMAVIVQRLVGAAHGTRYYPECAGVARSHNFYPVPPVKTEDGIAAVALGLGAAVVGGEACFRFAPHQPARPVQHGSLDRMVRSSQREFYALRLDEDGRHEGELTRLPLRAAEEDRTLQWVGSTYSPENHALYDGISRPGVRIVSFAPMLKHGVFPLAAIVARLLAMCEAACSTPVEIEFAVNLSVPSGEAKEFGFLQLRPIEIARELAELDIGELPADRLICRSDAVLGHGRIDGLRDFIVVDVHRFDRGRSADVAGEVARLNGWLAADRIPYVLIGVGRWGSAEPFLGIPVTWDQISGARVIVEAGFRDISVTPSQGSHFFQNITARNVGYFTVNAESGEGFVDWDWLAAQPAITEGRFVRHVRLDAPIVVKMNGRRQRGVIVKP